MSNSKRLEIKILPREFWLYSNPTILMVNFKGGKRAEAGQWALEIQKMLRGIINSLEGEEKQARKREQK